MQRRIDLLGTVPVVPLSGFELGDGRLMAADVDLAAGDLAGAAADAEALARCRSTEMRTTSRYAGSDLRK